MNKIIKETYKIVTVIIMCCMLITSFNLLNVTAESKDRVIGNDSVTMEQLQNIVLDYFKSNHIPYQVGTPEYLSYITEQLLYGTDQGLKKLDCYDMVTAYFTHYKNVYEDAVIKNSLNPKARMDLINTSLAAESVEAKDFLNTTVGMLRQEFSDLTQSEESFPILNNEQFSTNSIISSYLPSAAIGYALKWAGNEDSNSSDYHKSNPNYFYFLGADCTNYVSQCLYAGHIPMSGKPAQPSPDIKESTSKWYYAEFNQISVLDDCTTSWCKALDFYKYFCKKVTNYVYTKKTDIIKNCKAGDVVQFMNKTSGEIYHTVIITQKSTNSASYCGHTKHRYNTSVTIFNEETNKFVLMHFVK